MKLLIRAFIVVAALAAALVPTDTAMAAKTTQAFGPITVPVGTTTIGPINVSNINTATVSIDRTVAGGLNSLGADSTLDILIQTINGNNPPADEVEAQTTGGIFIDVHGNQANISSVTVGGIGPGTKIRAVLTVSGPSPIVVAGTVTAE